MPGRFWGEAVATAIYLLNRSPMKSVTGMTPYESWHVEKPSVDHLRTFGCLDHIKATGPSGGKFADRSTPMMMVGYEKGSKAYKLYNLESRKIVVSRDVVFEEEKGWNWNEAVYGGEDSSGDRFTVHFESDSVTSTVEVERTDEIACREPRTPNRDETGAESPNELTEKAEVQNGDAVPIMAPALETPEMQGKTRSLEDVYNATTPSWSPMDFDHVRELELCMLGAEEPSHHTEALKHQAWKKAMEDELKSI